MADVRNDIIGLCMNVGNDGVAIRNVMTSVSIGYMRGLKFRLGVGI